MIQKTGSFLKSGAKKAHKWLGFGPSVSILAISIVGLITIFSTPSAKLQVTPLYSPDPSEISGGSALLGDSSTIGEFAGANSSADLAAPVLVDNSSYLNNSGASSGRADRNGFTYSVKKGENCSIIASKFNITVGRLMSANNLGKSCSLQIGQELSIPDMESIKSVEKVPNYSSLPDVSGHLSFPLSNNKEPRYLNYNHTDIRSVCGTTIYASADGIVDSTGDPANWNDGLGGFVKVEHLFNDGGNYYTYYAGTSKNLVERGDMIEKGQPIAEVGKTGESDVQPPCHLRFGVIGAKNPFAKYISN